MENIFDIIGKFLSSVIMMSIIVHAWYNLLDKKISFKNMRNAIAIILLSIISIFNYYIINQYIRIFCITVVLMLFFRYLFKENIQKCIIIPIISQMVVMVSEMIFVVMLSSIFGLDSQDIINTQFGQFLSNIMISLIILLLTKVPLVKKFYKFLIKVTKKINKNLLLIFSFLIIIIANILTMFLYYRVEFRYLLFFNTCLTLFCLFIVVNSFKNKNNYIKVYDKYNTTLNSLKEYEDILDRYRVSNHENKNQLLTIRNMIPKSDKKTISYIDRIVENKLKDNDKVMFEVSIIPAGGLRGLIYSKVLTMKDLKINYELEISNSVKTVDLISLDDSLMLDICQVIGVYLDNAIEEVKKLEEKYINIEMYTEEKELIIEISNNYKEKIDIEKIENKGYTSKGKGHGYGLTLVKEILDNNKKLSNQKKISRESFTQVLKIKM